MRSVEAEANARRTRRRATSERGVHGGGTHGLSCGSAEMRIALTSLSLVGSVAPVVPRRAQLLRTTAIMLSLCFSSNSTHALALVTPVCTRCPPHCPMHAKKLGCHRGAAAAHTTAHDHSRNPLRPEPRLRCAACTYHPDSPVVSHQPVLLSALARVIVAPPAPRGALASSAVPQRSRSTHCSTRPASPNPASEYSAPDDRHLPNANAVVGGV